MADVESGANELPARSSSTASAAKERPAIVGVGASAGGLEALREFVSNLPADTGYSYVIAQHLSPQHDSVMSQLLEKHARIPIKEAKHRQIAAPNSAYIAPPNKDVRVVDGRILLTPPRLQSGPKPSVDLLFESIAENSGDAGIGIVLSGTGSDGARGVRAIKAAGGFVLAQDAASAKYSGMPEAAQHTGCVDIVDTPATLAQEVSRLKASHLQAAEIDEKSVSEDELDKILNALRIQTGVDFLDYKRGTIMRRVQARLVATDCATLQDYSKFLAREPDEANRLRRSILISVTSFFRDKEAFEALRKEVVKVAEARKTSESIRVWVAGCATGEEAYSIAMLLAEAAPGRRAQIFATDVDEDAVNIARAGVYPEIALADLPAEMRERNFERFGEDFRVKRHLRDSIVCAVHNLTRDPPFLNLDLVSCRNVLIYFQPQLQARMIEHFHLSLRPTGVLFLGKSESIGANEGVRFAEADRKHRLFRPNKHFDEDLASIRQRPTTTRGSVAFGKAPLRDAKQPAANVPDLPERFYDRFMPPSVLVDVNQKIVESFGDTGRFLSVGAGRPDYSITSLVPESIRLTLRAELFRCQRERTSRLSIVHDVDVGGRATAVQLRIEPLELRPDVHGYLISFTELAASIQARTEDGAAATTAEAAAAKIDALEDELRATREHLQTVVEELETSNEELQSLNEELQSANEELQASNEELHASNEELEASNEELQSTNEEVVTINAELRQKSEDLADIIDDLENIQNNVREPLIVVDQDLRIRRFNEVMSELFKLGHNDIGAPMQPDAWSVALSDLPQLTRFVIAGGDMQEREITINRRHYVVRIYPYFADKRSINGAVIVFSDVTDLSETRRELMKSEKMLKSALAAANEANNAKSIFLSNMSHEIRTPLNAIVGFSDLMANEVFGRIEHEKYGGYAADIHESSSHLARIVEDLLDLSRVEAGKMDAADETFDPRRATDAAIKILEPERAKNGGAIDTKYSTSVPYLRCDETMFRQIVINLVGNALKFSDKGSSVKVGLKNERSGAIVLTVEDSGLGMTDDDIAQAVEPFAQVGRQDDRSNTGLGLGLPLVVKFAELNDAKVNFASKIGEGTKVSVRFAPGRSVAA